MAKKATASKRSSSKVPADTSKAVDQLLEQRQQDAAAIAALQEREQELAELLARQEKQIKELQAELAGLKNLLAQAGDLERLTSDFKRELAFTLEQRDEDWKRQRAEVEKARQSETETLAKRLRESLRYDEQLEARRADVKRLDEALERLARQVEELAKSRGGLAAGPDASDQSDPSTMHRIAQLEQAARQVRADLKAQQGKAALRDEGVQKQLSDSGRQLDDFKRSVDEARTAGVQQQQRFTEFRQRLNEFDQFFEEWRAHKQLYEQQYQRSKQVLERLEALQSQLASRQNELSEMQRLGEERAKRQWEEWQASARGEIRSHQLSSDEQRRVQERRSQEIKDALDRLVERTDAHQDLISSLIDLRRAQLEHATEASDVISRADRLLTSARVSAQRKSK